MGILGAGLSGALLAMPGEAQEVPSWRFDFGPGPVASGWVGVSEAVSYDSRRGYGFHRVEHVQWIDQGEGDALERDAAIGTEPFLFSVKVPEGNYRVRVIMGHPTRPAETTVKAESRRLMLERVRTEVGQRVARSFTVNIRRPELPDGNRVRLKEREKGYLHWDDRLTLEFSGDNFGVAAVELEPASSVTTVFLLGDSTVTDQPNEPWNSWGQMLPRFFEESVAVANHAESGESVRSSLGARRVDKVYRLLREGDYVFLQFGHNDMKEREPDALDRYRANLGKMVDEIRDRGAVPVLVTSMERKAGVKQETLREYPETVRALAREKEVALIDLNAMSKQLYRALGPDLDMAFQDGSHHNNYGSYELARCVVDGIRQTKLGLVAHLAGGVAPFDPARPDPVAEFGVPASPAWDPTRPDGD